MNDETTDASPGGRGGQASPAGGDSIDYIKQYIDASAESADRARFILLVMVTASILALLAMWNTMPGNWTVSRLTVAADAQKFYSDDGKTVLRGEQAEQKVWPKFLSQGDYDSKPTQKEKDDYVKERRQAFESAKLFAAQPRFADLEHLKRYVEFLERMRTERIINVSVPFFGIVFDVNDLGMFAGVSFFIILLLFRFSLLRELRNLRLVFKQAHTVEQLELCYNRLAMQQVFTTPPQLDGELPKGKLLRQWAKARALFWDNVPKLLYLLPFAAHLAIFLNDRNTIPQVQPVFPGTSNSLEVSGAFLALNAALTGLCLFLGLKVDKSWRNHARFILMNRKPAQLLTGAEVAALEAKGDSEMPVIEEPGGAGERPEEKAKTPPKGPASS